MHDFTGRVVAEGVMFSSEQVAVAWASMVSAVITYQSIEAVKIIHGVDGHRVVFVDDTNIFYAKAGKEGEEGQSGTGAGTDGGAGTGKGSATDAGQRA